MFSWFKKEAIDSTANLVEKTGSALNGLFTSDHERLTHAEVMERMRQQPAAWAHQLNLINAQSASWFNSGWRPGLGWVCVLAALFYFVPQFAVATVVWTSHALDTPAGQALPAYPMGDNGLWQLVALLLGNGVLRQIDKASGTAK